MAVLEENEELLKLLIGFGVDTDATNSAGKSPLDLARSIKDPDKQLRFTSIISNNVSIPRVTNAFGQRSGYCVLI